jgi:hypothetical protein
VPLFSTNTYQDLHNGGSYTIHASVASFALNVLCVNVKEEELAPIVYGTWSNAVAMDSQSMAVNYWPIQAFPPGTDANNKTVLDDIFGWKDQDDDHAHARPSKTNSQSHYRIHSYLLCSLPQVPKGWKHRKQKHRLNDEAQN